MPCETFVLDVEDDAQLREAYDKYEQYHKEATAKGTIAGALPSYEEFKEDLTRVNENGNRVLGTYYSGTDFMVVNIAGMDNYNENFEFLKTAIHENVHRYVETLNISDFEKAVVYEEAKKAQQQLSDNLIADGYDGVVIEYSHPTIAQEYVAFEPNQIKSADPVTYDDAGNIIPLSERFNPRKEDIRYSLPTEPNKASEGIFEPYNGDVQRKIEDCKAIARAYGINSYIEVAKDEAEYIEILQASGVPIDRIVVDSPAVYLDWLDSIVVNVGGISCPAELAVCLTHENMHSISHDTKDKIISIAHKLPIAKVAEYAKEELGYSDKYIRDNVSVVSYEVVDEILSTFVGDISIMEVEDWGYVLRRHLNGSLTIDEAMEACQLSLHNKYGNKYDAIADKIYPLLKENLLKYRDERFKDAKVGKITIWNQGGVTNEGGTEVNGRRTTEFNPQPQATQRDRKRERNAREKVNYSLSDIPFFDAEGKAIDMSAISEAKALEMIDGRVRDMMAYDYDRSVVDITNQAKKDRRATRAYYAEERKREVVQKYADHVTEVLGLPCEIFVIDATDADQVKDAYDRYKQSHQLLSQKKPKRATKLASFDKFESWLKNDDGEYAAGLYFHGADFIVMNISDGDNYNEQNGYLQVCLHENVHGAMDALRITDFEKKAVLAEGLKHQPNAVKKTLEGYENEDDATKGEELIAFAINTRLEPRYGTLLLDYFEGRASKDDIWRSYNLQLPLRLSLTSKILNYLKDEYDRKQNSGNASGDTGGNTAPNRQKAKRFRSEYFEKNHRDEQRGNGPVTDTRYSLSDIPFFDAEGKAIDMSAISEAKALEMIDGRVRDMMAYDYDKSVVAIANQA